MVISHSKKSLFILITMRKEITLEMDPELLEKIETSPFELEDLVDLNFCLTIEINSLNKLYKLQIKGIQKDLDILKEKNELYNDIWMAKKRKIFILNKYKEINKPLILFDILVNENNPDMYDVEESKYSGRLDEIDYFLSEYLEEIQSMDRFSD
ncbi:hypothetical protein BK009_09490 [Methanobacterium subterraneum]|uniref:Uncharacterized protein n=3 Tax=Methanobacterium subterraneum TaxID=59277 RepID=A0A2H4VS02_9EURY|nr:hypothetical protein [Methanobacterium subterraneum]AUB60883.1 hypothetical protein BK009_09490 [Methanobacterium subterraneum]